ncbi:MAG: hypothetical protein ABEH77_00870 [Halobacteriaceae archaeon]
MTRSVRVLVAVAVAALLARPAAAHAGSLAPSGGVETPLWLFLLTGGGVVGGSFLLTTLVTDRSLIRELNDREVGLPARPLALAGDLAGGAAVAVLALVVVGGFAGPLAPRTNVAVLVVWVGWWAGYTMSTYLLGNTWPALNPWRRLARPLGAVFPDRAYPDWDAWPSVAFLLVMVFFEVVSPLAEAPRLLSAVVLAYTLVTVAGAATVGVGEWFRHVDPVARVFRYYGVVAPVRRTRDGVGVSLPGGDVPDSQLVTGPAGVAFVVALLWSTTFDGLVTTPAWAALAGVLVGAGVPPLAVYAAAMVAGFLAFWAVYRRATRRVRATADSYVTAAEIARRFAPTLLPIAAGYHAAHFLGYFLSFLPQLGAVLADPLSPPAVELLPLPAWFNAFPVLLVVGGHILAVWLAHATAFELFAGRLQPLRSQYPFIVVMVLYTMTSLYIITQPSGAPPYL